MTPGVASRRHKVGRLAALSDDCNRTESAKMPVRAQNRARTKSSGMVRSRAVQARLCRIAAAVVAAAVVVAGAAIPAAGGPGSAQDLRRQDETLERRSGSALLELYALDSALGRANSELAAVRGRARAVAAEQARVRKRLSVAVQTLEAAELMLADRLRGLYEQGDADPLEILLGARTVEDALAGLDGLQFAAEHDKVIVARTKAARASLLELARKLRGRREELRSLTAAAEARAGALARRRAERSAFVAELERQQRLNAAQIGALERRAQAAQAKARALAPVSAGAPLAAPAGSEIPIASPSTPAPPPAAEGGRTLTVTATAYSLPGRTATGIPVAWGVVAVDPAVIPLGTRMTIPGYGEGVAADVGPAVRGAKIDLWFPSRSQALTWGVRTVTITLR